MIKQTSVGREVDIAFPRLGSFTYRYMYYLGRISESFARDASIADGVGYEGIPPRTQRTPRTDGIIALPTLPRDRRPTAESLCCCHARRFATATRENDANERISAPILRYYAIRPRRA